METPTQNPLQPQMPETEVPSKSHISGYVITALVTAIVVGGVAALFVINKTETTEVEPSEQVTDTQPATTSEVVTITDVATSDTPVNSSEITSPVLTTAKARLMASQFTVALSSSRQVDVVDQNPTDTNKLYYITDGTGGLGTAIWQYDASTDSSYKATADKSNPTFDVAAGSRVLLDYKPKTKGNLIYRVGLSGNNYVFFEQGPDYSAGPCSQYSIWVDYKNPGSPKLQSIDVTSTKPIAKPFTPSAADIEKNKKLLKECTDSL